jgi:hypothetical protein
METEISRLGLGNSLGEKAPRNVSFERILLERVLNLRKYLKATCE